MLFKIVNVLILEGMVRYMVKLLLDKVEKNELAEMLEKAEKKFGAEGYSFDPGFTVYSCSCTAHKKSCGWD